MAHTWPDNAIQEVADINIPREEWIHVMMTHDGSGKAKGLRLFMQGKEVETILVKDNLYKDILFYKTSMTDPEPGLKIGARMRGKGFKEGLVDELEIYDRALSPPEILKLAEGDWSVLSSSEKTAASWEYYLSENREYRQWLKELTGLRQILNTTVEAVEEVMVMKDREIKRPTFVLTRGLYDAHTEEVSPGTPEAILPYPEELPKNRTGLAQWLISGENPLTARVTVNRYWQQYFGKGIVTTADDFGNQGALPSNPQLLDWLATEFIHSGWDVKAMQKLIVMSATYRQSSIADENKRAADPNNTWLSRGPASRLSAEMLRDNALAASGLLVRKIGGPSVKPYQPDGLWEVNGATYVPDTGENLYRRSMYTLWKRTVPPPTMNVFDAPSRSYCVVNRQKTNTPLQALTLINDPQFIEASRALAEKAMELSENTGEKIIHHLFAALTGRYPDEKEEALLSEMYQEYYRSFSEFPDKMTGLLTTGEHTIRNKEQNTSVAAYALVANTVMNMDATIMKR